MKVVIHQLHGEPFEVDANPDDTVGSLKKLIYDIQGTSPMLQQLMIRDVVLKQDLVLGELNFDDKAELQLVTTSRHLLESLGILDVSQIDIGNFDGDSALHTYARSGETKIVQCLLDFGANLSEEARSMCTALHLAAENGHRSVCQLLLDRHADTTMGNWLERTPLFVAALEGHRDVCELLLFNRADVHESDEDAKTTLYAGAMGGHAKVCELLVLHRADVHKTDNVGWSPLRIAKEFEMDGDPGHALVSKLLFAHGAKIQQVD